MALDVNISKLMKLIESFYKLTKIKVAVYDDDFNEIFAYPEKDSTFCEMMSRFPEVSRNCRESVKKLCAECRKAKRLVTLTCHAGLTEAVAPLYENDVIIGYIMFGQITNMKDKKKFVNRAEFLCRNYPLDKLEFAEKIITIPYKNNEQLKAVSEIINAFIGYINFDHIIVLKREEKLSFITEYIDNNLSADLSAKTLCKKFYISKTLLYEITKPLMPDGIAKYICAKRMEKAKELIAETDKPIEEIAGIVGFMDSGYFRRVFKKINGMPASTYRKMQKRDILHRSSDTSTC